MWSTTQQFKTGICKTYVRKKAIEVAETSLELRSLASNVGGRGSWVHVQTHEYGKSPQTGQSGSQLEAGEPVRNLWQCIQLRG